MLAFRDDRAQGLAQIAATASRNRADNASRLIAEAEQLASTITDPGHRAQILAGIASTVAQVDPKHAAALALRADEIAATINDISGRAAATVASALTRTGQWQKAESVARMISDPDDLAQALAELAAAITGTDPEQAAKFATEAEKVARAAPQRHHRVRMEPNVVVALTETREWGHLDQAIQDHYNPADPDPLLASAASALTLAGLSERAEIAARAITSPDTRARALAQLAAAIADTDPDRAAKVAADAEQTARIYTASRSRPLTLAVVATAVAKTRPGGLPTLVRDAENGARESMYPEPIGGIPISILGPAHVITAAAMEVAAVLSGVDRPAARRLAADAEQFARAANDPAEQARALAAVAAAGAMLDRDQALRLAADAEQFARAANDPAEQAGALAAVAAAGAMLDRDQALRLAADAEHAVRTYARSQDLGPALIAIASVYARAGQWERAQEITHMIDGPDQADAALATAEAIMAQARIGQTNPDTLTRASWLIAS